MTRLKSILLMNLIFNLLWRYDAAHFGNRYNEYNNKPIEIQFIYLIIDEF